MGTVVRSIIIYLVIWAVFRLVGRRTMAQITTFDFVLLLIIGEATQQALLDDDSSFTNAVIAIVTLVAFDDLLTILRTRFPRLDAIMSGKPVVILHDGQPLHEPMHREHIDPADILNAARCAHGIKSITGVEQAVLETNGEISIIPKNS